MKRTICFISLVLLLAVASGCGGRKIRVDESKIGKNDFISLSVVHLKDKGKKYDVEIGLKNLADKSVIVLLSDLHCYKGTVKGSLRHTFFNTGERTIDFAPYAEKQFPMVCTLSSEQEGNYRIVIARVYDNPSNDGATRGKVIAEKLEFNLEPQEE